jgi:hypothetical protein
VGAARQPPSGRSRQSSRLGLPLWRDLSGACRRRRHRHALGQQRGDVRPSRRDRQAGLRWLTCRAGLRRSRLASDGTAIDRAQERHPASPAALRTRTQSDRERLGISPRQQAQQTSLAMLRRHRRGLCDAWNWLIADTVRVSSITTRRAAGITFERPVVETVVHHSFIGCMAMPFLNGSRDGFHGQVNVGHSAEP